MKIRHLVSVLILTLVATGQLWATGPRVSAGALASHVNEVYAVDLPPFVSSDIAGRGTAVELVEAVFRAAGVDAVVTTLPLLPMAKYYLIQEKALAVMGHRMALRDVDQSRLIVIPLLLTDERLFYHKPSYPKGLVWNGKLKSLAGKRIGAFKGEEVGVYKEAGLQVSYGIARSLFQKLAGGKIDVVSMPQASAQWILQHRLPAEKANIVAMKPALGETPLAIVFNKQHAQGEAIAAQFRMGLQKLIEDGRYREILERGVGQGERQEQRIKRLLDQAQP